MLDLFELEKKINDRLQIGKSHQFCLSLAVGGSDQRLCILILISGNSGDVTGTLLSLNTQNANTIRISQWSEEETYKPTQNRSNQHFNIYGRSL